MNGARTRRYLPVDWHMRRTPSGYIDEFTEVAAVPGFVLPDGREARKSVRQAVPGGFVLFSVDRDRTAADPDSYAAGLFLTKILQRGRAPLPTLRIERVALEMHGLLDTVEDLVTDEDSAVLDWRPRSNGDSWLSPGGAVGLLATRRPFVLHPEFKVRDGSLFDASCERRFLDAWVPANLGPEAGHWFTPQAPLDRILEAAGQSPETTSRRIDFLFAHPGGSPLAIEIDDPGHASAEDVDQDRDRDLSRAGVDRVRVSKWELETGDGPNLQKIRQHCERAFEAHHRVPANEAIIDAVDDCIWAARVQFAVARALQYGWLREGGTWDLRLHGAGQVQVAGVVDALDLLASFDDVYGCRTVPERCILRRGDVEKCWTRSESGAWLPRPAPPESQETGQRLVLRLDADAGPYADAPEGDNADLIIRPSALPVPLRVATHVAQGGARRRPIRSAAEDDAVTAALERVLRHLFRMRAFREQQREAILKLLDQQDCIVLLPTGAGKSLIYQFAGMMMPGVTVIVDPTISLMEDQAEGLAAAGFDRSTSISGQTPREEADRRHERFSRGEYQFLFLSPERLQIPKFQLTMDQLTHTAQVSLTVVDEAHCVSEWGHDFRPAYLQVAERLRQLGGSADGKPPPLLALTGTASPPVLRDLCVETEVNTVLHPASFNRAELEFRLLPVLGEGRDAGGAQNALRRVLSTRPGDFEMSKEAFYAPNGKRTMSGIVFVPLKSKKRKFGVPKVARIVSHATDYPVARYSSDERNDSPFLENRRSTIVATKSFGVGIDKDNVRWTAHLGMPGSIESFYQEAGRAGRDGEGRSAPSSSQSLAPSGPMPCSTRESTSSKPISATRTAAEGRAAAERPTT